MDQFDFKIDIICEISYLNEDAPSLKDHKKSFEEHFHNAINFLERWVKEKLYISWEEDDVNFLNFLLHSRWLYKEIMFKEYSSLLKELASKVTCPLILSLNKEDQFFLDLSYWFITQGEEIFNKLNLQKERDEISLHLGKEK